MTFPLQIHKTLTTFWIFVFLGVVSALAAVINAIVTDAEGTQPLALLVLLLGIPGIWVFIVACMAMFSLRVTDQKIEKLFANVWPVSSKPISELRRAFVEKERLYLEFRDRSTIRIGYISLRDKAGLADVLGKRCAHAKISWPRDFLD